MELERRDDDDLEKVRCPGDRTLVQGLRRLDEGGPFQELSVRERSDHGTNDSRLRHVVLNGYELVLLAAELARELSDPSLLAREPDRTREAETMTALRHIAERAANPEILWIKAGRRRQDIPLLGKSNDNRPPVEPASAEPRAA